MVLDIAAHKNMHKLDIHEDILAVDALGDDPRFGHYWKIEAHDAFPEHHEGLDEDAYYSRGDEVGYFRAGSYSSYGAFREWLMEMVAREYDARQNKHHQSLVDDDYAFTGGEFNMLYNFSDRDGVIGPVISEELYREFRAFERVAEDEAKKGLTQPWMLDNYKNFLKAFDMSRKNGMVRFCQKPPKPP